VLTSLYANGAESIDPTTGRNAYDVMVAGRDIGIIAVILVLFMSSVVTITVLNNKATLKTATINGDTVKQLAGSIDTLRNTMVDNAVVYSTGVHNLSSAWLSRPCMADEMAREALKQLVARPHVTETTIHTKEKTI
jgi:hypothetical protein